MWLLAVILCLLAAAGCTTVHRRAILHENARRTAREAEAVAPVPATDGDRDLGSGAGGERLPAPK